MLEVPILFPDFIMKARFACARYRSCNFMNLSFCVDEIVADNGTHSQCFEADAVPSNRLC